MNIALGRLLRWRRFLSPVLLGGIVALPCFAQEIVTGAAPMITLTKALEKTDWNPATQGALIVILPNETNSPSSSLHITGNWSAGSDVPPPTPQQGRYRLSQWETYFGRKVIRAGGVTVFAPATMRVLNYRNLPKPDAYRGISFEGKMNLLAASLSPAQWRRMGSAEGIGAGDLTTTAQREIFRSLIAPNARLVTTRQTGADEFRYEDKALTAEQRSGLRIRVYRAIDWRFQMGANGTAGFGPSEERDGRVGYFDGLPAPFESRSEIYGVKVAEDVPNRLKPGGLDFSAAALDAKISLDGAATAGDLVERVRDATRLELYADARYLTQTVLVRGTSARAGDVLKALCYGLTGTFRRVGPALLLTDDVVGYGTRMAILAEWSARNRSLALQRNNQATRELRKNAVAQYIPYDFDSEKALGKELQQKIDDYLKLRSAPMTKDEQEKSPMGRQLRVPVRELPSWAQERVRRQLEFHDKNSPDEAHEPDDQKVRRDFALLQVRSGVQFLFPGADAMEIPSAEGSADLLAPMVLDETFADEAPEKAASVMAITIAADKFPVRALIVRPESAEDAQKAAKAAAQSGLTELWAETGLGDTTLLDAVIAAAKENRLTARAVVRVLRPGAGVEAPPDVNVRGETTSAIVAASHPSLSFYARGLLWGPKWDVDAEMARQRRLGDWARPDAPTLRENLRRKIALLAGRLGLGGIVLRDWEPPGYSRYSFDKDAPNSPSEQLGYSEEMRLAFLRENFADPVDINLVDGGMLMPFAEGQPFAATIPDVSLPYFPTYVSDGFTPPTKNPDAATRTKEADKRWANFRADAAAAFRRQFAPELKAILPKMPLLTLEGADFPRNYSFHSVMSVDPEMRAAQEAAEGSGAAASETPSVALHRSAKTIYACLSYYPTKDMTQRKADFLRQQREAVKLLSGMDGVALDFSSVGVSEALSALSGMEIK